MDLRGFILLGAWAGCSFFCIAQALAQDSGNNDPLSPLRTSSSFTTADDQIIEDWVAARLTELKTAIPNAPETAEDQRAADLAANDFRNAFQSERNHSGNTPLYIRQFAQIASSTFVAEFQSDKAVPWEIHRAMAWALKAINHIATREALTAGLNSRWEDVRYTCAMAFVELQDAIAADTQMTRRMITLFGNVGAAEANSATRGALYKAMSYSDAGMVPDVAQAMTRVFAARVQARKTGDQVRADRAELLAYEYLLRVRTNIPQAQRPPLVRELAGLLALDVQRYESALPFEKRTLQERIEVGEELLEALTGASGGVRAAMRQGGAAVTEEMGKALNSWVGAEGQPGTLNQAPWSVPVGGVP